MTPLDAGIERRMRIVRMLDCDAAAVRWAVDLDDLAAWLLDGDPDPDARLAVLEFLRDHHLLSGGYGTVGDLVLASQEVLEWACCDADPLPPVPRHFTVLLLTTDEEAQFGHLPAPPHWGFEQVRVRSRPTKWFITARPDDAL